MNFIKTTTMLSTALILMNSGLLAASAGTSFTPGSPEFINRPVMAQTCSDPAVFSRWLNGSERDVASSKCISGMYNLGILALNPKHGGVQDPEKVIFWFRAAGTNGHRDAQKLLGDYYKKGRHGLPVDLPQAAIWYARAGSQGVKEARKALSSFSLDALGKAIIDYEPFAFEDQKTFALLNNEFSARKDVSGALFKGANALNLSASEMIASARKGAEEGHKLAQYALGEMYCTGISGPKNPTEAIRYFKQAAAQNFAPAQHYLGIIYCNYEGVPPDFIEAVKYFTQAATQGYKAAQYDLGVMHRDGKGTKTDLPEAIKWFQKAADQGHRSAQFNLGTMYKNGEGVPQNFSKAIEWLGKAADQGDPIALCSVGL